MNRRNQLLKLLSPQQSDAPITCSLVAELLTEKEIDLVSGGRDHGMGGSYTQSGGAFTQRGGGSHMQRGGGGYIQLPM